MSCRSCVQGSATTGIFVPCVSLALIPSLRQKPFQQPVPLTDRQQPFAAHHPHRLQPGLELGGGPQAEHLAQVEGVVEGGALVVEHDVVRPRHPHEVVAAGHAEQGHQGVHVVLVGLGVVGVADVAAHGQAEQLAAEVVLQPGADDLLAVVEVLRADEADHGVDQKRLEAPGDAVGARLAGLLVDAVVGVGRQGAPLAGLEVHDVVADAAALERQRRLPRLLEQRRVMPKLRLAASVPAIDWNTRSTGAPASMAPRVVVTWARTQDWVGISKRRRSSSIIASSAQVFSRLSVAGLTPITASPPP